ncbi:MAG: PAS domain-containing protein, partial [Salinivirgaceae bacterium]
MEVPDKNRENLRKKAEEIFKKRGITLSNDVSRDVNNLLEELSIYQIELEEQNKQLQETQLEYAEQRNEYIDLFDHAPIAYFMIDRHQRFIRANQKALILFGITNTELPTATLKQFIHPNNQDDIYFLFRTLTKDSPTRELQVRLVDKQNRIRVVHLSAKAIETTERYIRVSALDQTKESELQEQASFRAAIIENVQECIFAMQHGKITFWNRGATELLGYNANYTNEMSPHF